MTNKLRSRKGYSLAELLIVIAIIAIISAISVGGIFSQIKSIRQMKLDTTARTIYTAAQNRLTELYSSGDTARFGDVIKRKEKPGDWADDAVPNESSDIKSDFESGKTLTVIRSDAYYDKDGHEKNSTDRDELKRLILPENAVSEEVYNNNWVIEFNPENGYIYSVFYSEDEAHTPDKFYDEPSGTGSVSEAVTNDIRESKQNRITETDARVGYYFGNFNIGAGKDNQAIKNYISWDSGSTSSGENGEQLKLNFVAELPDKLQMKLIDYAVTITGKTSKNTYRYEAKKIGGGTTKRTRSLIIDRLVTDDGRPDLSFYTNFCTDKTPDEAQCDDTGASKLRFISRTGKLIPGEDLEISFGVRGSNDTDGISAPLPDIKTVNSLFGNGTDTSDPDKAKAVIVCGRHLQNLDVTTSHIGEEISGLNGKKLSFVSAVQTGKIDFTDTAKYSWKDIYGTRKFSPIEFNNNCDFTYDGNEYVIKGLDIGNYPKSTSALNAGLFGVFRGKELKNITLTGLKANGDNNNTAGALAAQIGKHGESDPEVSINNCKVYLDREDYDGKDETYSFIKSRYSAGGLVGVLNTNVNINDSLAATVISSGSGKESATNDLGKGCGGLIGWAKAKFIIRGSYADCYLSGGYIGGLVGYSAAGSDAGSSVTGSYSAGYALLDSQTQMSSGFVSTGTGAISLAAITGSYTIFDTGSNSSIAGIQYSTTPSNKVSCDGVYYYNNSQNKTDNGGESATVTALKESGVNSIISKLNETLNRNDANSRFEFDTKTSDSKPYNLKSGLGLKIYEFPHIKKKDTATIHYGDWVDKEFKSGTLVYYEKYSDGKWGFDGNGINTLYDDMVIKANDASAVYVVSDGYALIYDKNDYKVADNIQVSFGGTSYSSANGKLTAVNAEADSLANASDETWNKATVFLLLPDEIINAGLNEDGSIDTGYGNGVFYQKISVLHNGATDHYFFNPHFAKTVIKADSAGSTAPEFEDGDRIYIRTARQLYLMSKFYANYSKLTEKCIFYQELDIDYGTTLESGETVGYGWSDTAGIGTSRAIRYPRLSAIASDRTQRPIADGSSDDECFIAEYDGRHHIITGVSINSTEKSFYSGLFGLVGSSDTSKSSKTGKLENIVIAADYKTVQYSVYNKKHAQNNGEKAYIGMLTGYLGAESEITNCAAASYELTGYSYGNSDIYAGGLVGFNAGYISNSSADIPVIKLYSNGTSDAYVGSFTGYNSSTGYITDSYGLAYIDAGTSDTSGEFKVGGFAGINYGHIYESYCATAYTSSNIDSADISAFTQGSLGIVERCMYLNGGNYYFVNAVRLYNYDEDSNINNNAAHATTAQLKGLVDNTDTTYTLENDLSTVFGSASESMYHSCTNTDKSVSYPYPAVVKDKAGALVHYGEWAYDSSFGDIGFIYWENETGGSNNGYHFYMIDNNGEEHSTLCTAHDDGGIIKAYGYGYYYRAGNEPAAEWDNVNIGIDDKFKDADEKTPVVVNAVNAIEKQFSGTYKFRLYRTTESGVKPDTLSGTKNTTDGGMYLTGDSAYASCTLTYGTGSGIKYIFTPFFAKSMIMLGDNVPIDGEKIKIDENDAKNTYLGHGTGYDADDKPLKANGFPFEIRSTSQLQNINWRHDYFNAFSTVTESDTNKWAVTNNYTYLRWYAYGDATYGKDVNESEGNNYYWKQSHDTNGSSQSFAPIGGLWDTAKTVQWADPVSKSYIAYFNGAYDGRSYKIQNVNIDSTSQTVGLFGMTVCANLKNIILYSNGNDTIQTNKDGLNWYCLGGLIGFAAQGKIENCAVAGYTIKDNRIHSGAGNADIGGLVGFCATNIDSCSSVNDIVVSRGYFDDRTIGYTLSRTVNVGGMSGVCSGIISNSYCGGSISSTVDRNADLNIYVGGIIGGEWYRASGLQGLTKYRDMELKIRDSSLKLPTPTVQNCYSYIKLPIEGQNRLHTVAPLVSIGDINGGSAALGITITVKNSFYYAAYAGTAYDKNSENVYNGAHKTYYVNYTYLDADGRVIQNQNLRNTMAIDFNDMRSLGANGEITGKLKDKLNKNNAGAFGIVDITENGGAKINGKYSFPGADAFLKGENYPFPAVITQENPFYDSDYPMSGEAKNVYVHYGAWPMSDGLFTDTKSAEIDLLTSDTGVKDISVKYYTDGLPVSMTAEPAVNVSSKDNDIVSCSFTRETDTASDTSYYMLHVQGIKEGFETLTISYNVGGKTYTTTVDIAVTADMAVNIIPRDPEASNLYTGGSVEYIISARDKNGNEIETSLDNWRAEIDNSLGDIVSCELREETDVQTGKKLIILKANGRNVGKTNVYVSTQNIYAKYEKTEPYKTNIESRRNMLELDVKSREDTAEQSVRIMLYADNNRLDASNDHAVELSYAGTLNGSSTARNNFDYWTSTVKNDVSINKGRIFAGWVMDNGEQISKDTVFKSAVNAYASWKCTKTEFYDASADGGKQVKTGTLYYYNGSFYTDNILSVPAENAPAHTDRSGTESFSGYWTEPHGGVRVTDSDGVFLTDTGDSIPAKLYGRWNVSSDEYAANAAAVSAEHEAAMQSVMQFIGAANTDDEDTKAEDDTLRAPTDENIKVKSDTGTMSNADNTAVSGAQENEPSLQSTDSGADGYIEESGFAAHSIIDPDVITDEDISYNTDDD